MIGNKIFKNFFNRYDEDNVLHNGFIQSIDLSAYTDITLLNDITDTIIDSYLYNEFKNRVMLSRWKKYLSWDETKKDFIINSDFYNEAVVALYVYLAKSEKFFDILKTNFTSLSASEMETINHGSKSTGRVYGEALKTNVYDKVTIELLKGTETENRGTHTDTRTRGTHTDTETRGAFTDTETHATYTDTENVGTHTDTENKGQQINTNQKIDSIHPFDANDFVNDAKSDETQTNGTQQNSTVYGAQSNSTQYGQQQITNANGAQETTSVFGAQSDSDVFGAQENTRSYGKTTNETKTRTDTETTGAHTDNETVSAYIDTKTRTKVILLSPDKYYEIQKELAKKNVYTLFAQAVNECFLNDNYSFQALEKWGCII